MAFNFDSLTPDPQWFPLSGPTTGVDLLVRYASPEAGEEFQRIITTKQIMKMVQNRLEVVPGRNREYILEFCRFYVLDWRGVNGGDDKPLPYSPENLVRILVAVRSAMDSVLDFVKQEEMFFTTSGSKLS